MPLADLSPAEQAEYDILTKEIEAYQDREKCRGRGGLLNFIRMMWKVIEPERPLVEGWVLSALCEHLEAVTFGDINRLLINVPPGSTKSLTSAVFYPAWEWGPMGLVTMRYMCASYSGNLSRRDNIRFRRLLMSPEYQRLWGDVFGPSLDQFSIERVSNDKTGWKLATSVGGVGTGERADRVIIDDGNNPLESESPAIMDTTRMWFTEIIPDRLNALEESSIINIQQRTNEGDISGIILELGLPYDHLCLPMEYDPQRHCATSIGWQDPRGLDKNGELLTGAALERTAGTLAWPERFSRKALNDLQLAKGEYAWCTPGKSPVLMDDLSLKPISEVKEGEQIIGFTIDTKPNRPGERYSRRKLKRATVLAVSKSVQKVVKITLSSGRIVRCTPDHKWYGGRPDKTHPAYRVAKVGCKLFRVCDPEMPTLKTEEDWRDAGWLAGFFDGEGSCAFQARRDGDRSTGLISFSQGTGRNLPLCEKLEDLLTKFGFEYRYNESIRSDRIYDRDEATPQRWYTLKRNGLPIYHRFVHLIKPVKWRDRLIESALGASFCIEKEIVVSIDDDGEEMVYGLTTTTGNYVVWGLASSNSGQYQQLPTPRGGGLFKREWIEAWPPLNPDGSFPEDMINERGGIRLPALEYVVGWVDTAMTEKQENDFCAMSVIGIFRAEGKGTIVPNGNGTFTRLADDYGFPKAIVIHAWQKRLTIHGPPQEIPPGVTVKEWNSPEFLAQRRETWGLVEWVADTVKRYKIDYLGIETQALGHTLQQELAREHMHLSCAVELVPARGDKTARGYAVQGSFSSKQIFFPMFEDGSYPKWLTPLADQLFVFPKGTHDDLVDTLTGGIKHLRDTGMFERREIWDKEEEHSISWAANRRVNLPYET